MKDPRKVVISHLVSEKNTLLRESQNAYVFLVAHEAGKVEIKQAVESLFKVSVADVRTITLRGKIKRLGRSTGKRPNWKKAVVSLAKGQTISQLDTV